MSTRLPCIPMPLQIVVDDVGWWRGEDGSQAGEPFRTGIPRQHVPEDYEALVTLGRDLGMRIQSAMVLAEWDRGDRLRRLPTATWMGRDWQNPCRDIDAFDQAAAILRQGRDAVEQTLHGLGHEYWERGRMSRAEWFDKDQRMRPPDQVRLHLDAYAGIARENGLDANPRSFVPCAFLYRFGMADGGLAGILKERGVRSISTTWRMAREREPETAWFGVECGLMVIQRSDNPLRWCSIGACAQDLPTGPVLGLHWPNLLHPDPARNGEVVMKWVATLKRVNGLPDRFLAPDTETFCDQLAYHAGTSLRHGAGQLELDFSVVDGLGIDGLGQRLRLHLPSSLTLAEPPPGATILSCEDLPFARCLILERQDRASSLRLRLRNRA